MASLAPEALRRRRGRSSLDQLDLQLAGDLEDPVVPVELAVHDAPGPRIGDELEARPAGARGRVEIGAIDAHTVLRGLEDRVRLSVDGRDAVPVLEHVADLVAVRHAADRPV